MTCGAYADCGGDKQLQCRGSPNYCTPGHASFSGYAYTFDCDSYQSQINSAISPLSVNLGPNQTVQTCLACGGNTSPLSCPGPVCDAGYTHHDTSALYGSIGNCGYSGLTLTLINTHGLCSPASPVAFDRPAHDAWPISQTPSLERGTVFVLHGRGSSCGANMDNLLVAGGLLDTNNLVYCVEYAQGDDGQPGARDVSILRVPDGEDGANSACIQTDTCEFDNASPVLVETASEYSVNGVSTALYQAMLKLPVVGEVTLIPHSQGGFIVRDLLHNHYDDLRFRGRNVTRVISLAHPYFGREFDPHLYAPFQCIDQTNSFDCQTGRWLWGWQEHLALASPYTMDNTEFPQVEWSALISQGSVEQPDGTGGVSQEPQPEACTSIFGGVLTSTVIGDNSVPVQSSLGIDEFGFFPGPDVLNFGLSVEAPIAISHNATNLLAYLRSTYPGRLPVAYMNTTPASFNALSFENAGAVALPDADVLNITGNLTLELWARPASGGQGAVLAGEDGRYYLAMFGDRLYFALNDAATGWASVQTSFDLPVGRWSHIALTYATAGGAEIYVNGHRQAFPAHSGALNISNPAYVQFRIGNREASGNVSTFDGQIDEVRIWSSHRSADQIRGGMKTVTPDASLQGWWRFGEQGGNLLLDASGNGRDIALDSIDPLLQPQRFADADIPGGARYFDGIEDTVAVLSDWPEFNMDQNLTIEAWIFPRGPGGSNGGVILNKEGEYALVRRTDGTIGWSLANTNPGWASVATGVTAPQNDWTHIAMTYDGTNVRIYRNGTLASTQTYAGGGSIGDFSPALTQLRIGGRQGVANDQPFHGVIDEVRLWSVTRSASEIAAGYLAGVDPASTGLVGYWQFSENNRGVAFDASTHVSATVGRHASLGSGGTDTSTWSEQTLVSALPQALFLDTDGDGLADVYETHTGTYVDAGNTGTDPYGVDSDGDGLADGAEVLTYNTDPTLADTDGDGFDDATEITAGTDPTDDLSWPVLSDGDMNNDGQFDLADLLVGYRVLLNQLPLTPLRLSHGDVAPQSLGIPVPDGQFTAGDVYILQRMLLVP